ncbi:FadR/GntR family transcriptional regulator [Pelosinus sp. IPA-1]|uniref:FadR/GntR family transcriptional regulator n=1 Tax=Pelosinus sp. IPA-1 TaxID=3029569 RepID=UPI0024362874|nr:FadR/GntR family transcriptional regulator [Pelosinus sp. IPA-1]GMA98534.1 GntR family transcriptional regulator [Pelosinus sp. IPA-1]
MNLPIGLKIVKRKRLVDEVIKQLQQQISLGLYPIGSKIPPESELVTLLGVSRTTLREAIRVLSNTGLLDVRQGDGTYVLARCRDVEPFEQRLRRASLLEIYEVRQLLEMEIAKRAATLRTEEHLNVMRESLRKRIDSQKAGNIREYVESDIAFHNAIASASGNSILSDLYLAFSNVVSDALTKLVQDTVPLDYENILKSHQQLLKAIEDRDEEEAKKWAVAHLNKIISRLI